ncbi:unnamed protein product [Linum trigynum]|uniref:Uncharacterized protein n=1 Tax=Linum trigynum TaxID=586398 RepID=A0AAV2E4V7_9ROSI
MPLISLDSNHLRRASSTALAYESFPPAMVWPNLGSDRRREPMDQGEGSGAGRGRGTGGERNQRAQASLSLPLEEESEPANEDSFSALQGGLIDLNELYLSPGKTSIFIMREAWTNAMVSKKGFFLTITDGCNKGVTPGEDIHPF